jgi:hypothetical protein
MSATQIEQDTTTEDPGPDVGRERPLWLAVANVVVFLIAVALLGGLALNAVTGLGHAKVDTFTDPLGRDCTQLTKGHALALSCAPKPLEDRIADGLRGQA